MSKKKDLPAMPFYFGDWKKDPGVLAMTFEEKGIWLEIIGLMWESEERGYLTIGGKPIPTKLLSKMLKLSEKKLKKVLKNFDEMNVFSVENGKIHSRKILNILDLQAKRSKAGRDGGLAKARQNASKRSASPLPNAENENETVNKTPITPDPVDPDLKKKSLQKAAEDLLDNDLALTPEEEAGNDNL